MSGENRGTSASGRAGGRLPPKSGDRGSRAPARASVGAGASGPDRGQTTLDFAIGVSVFLSVMLFVFAFVPGILQPFNLSGEEDIGLSERVASDLSQGLLGNASTPYVLESTCTVQFFDTDDDPPDFCKYTGTTIHERLGVDTTHNLNVTMEGSLSGGLDSELICWDSAEEDLDEVGSGDCTDSSDEILAIGGVPPEANDATVTARRIVSLHGENLTMKVVVW